MPNNFDRIRSNVKAPGRIGRRLHWWDFLNGGSASLCATLSSTELGDLRRGVCHEISAVARSERRSSFSFLGSPADPRFFFLKRKNHCFGVEVRRIEFP